MQSALLRDYIRVHPVVRLLADEPIACGRGCRRQLQSIYKASFRFTIPLIRIAGSGHSLLAAFFVYLLVGVLLLACFFMYLLVCLFVCFQQTY